MQINHFRWDCEHPGTEYTCGFPCGSAGKESACNAGDPGLIPGLGRSPGAGKGYPVQYSGLENSIDRIVQGVIKSRTRLNDLHLIRGAEYMWGCTLGVSTHFSPAAAVMPDDGMPGEGGEVSARVRVSDVALLRVSCTESHLDGDRGKVLAAQPLLLGTDGSLWSSWGTIHEVHSALQ